MFPITIEDSISIATEHPQIAAQQILDHIGEFLLSNRLPDWKREGSTIKFSVSPPLTNISKWPVLTALSNVKLLISPADKGIRVSYQANLLEAFLIVTGTLGLVSGGVWISSPEYRMTLLVFVPLIWGVCYGAGIYLLGKHKARQFLKRLSAWASSYSGSKIGRLA